MLAGLAVEFYSLKDVFSSLGSFCLFFFLAVVWFSCFASEFIAPKIVLGSERSGRSRFFSLSSWECALFSTETNNGISHRRCW